MASRLYTVLRVLTIVALSASAASAHATWQAVMEGMYFSDFDDPEVAGTVFPIFPATIYEPAPYFIGHVGTADASDSINFYFGQSSGLELTALRADFSTAPVSSIQGMRLVLTTVDLPGTPLLSVDLMANANGHAFYSNTSIRLDRVHTYNVSLSTIGEVPNDALLQYSLSFTIPETPAVPEPAQWAMLLLGLAVIAGSRYTGPAIRRASVAKRLEG